MGINGADVDQLRTLSKTMAKAADQLSQIASQTSSQLGATGWHGPDGDRFRSQWNSQSVAQLRSMAGSLHEAASALQRNADQQDQASAAGGSTGASGASGTKAGGTEKQVDTALGGASLISETHGLIGDMDAVRQWSRGIAPEGAGLGSTMFGAAGAALSAVDLDKRMKGIAEGNMTDFLGGLVDVAGMTLGVVGVTAAPEAGLFLAGADIVTSGLGGLIDGSGDSINDAMSAAGGALHDVAAAGADAASSAVQDVAKAATDTAAQATDAAAKAVEGVGNAIKNVWPW